MKNQSIRQRVRSSNALALALVALLAFGTSAHAATYYWDADGTTTAATGGTGTWDTATSLWRSVGEFGALGAWSNSPTDCTAIFGGTAGTVTLGGSISANKLVINTTGYNLSGAQTLTLNGTTPTISVAELASGPMTATIGNNTATVLAGNAGLTKFGSGTLTLNGSAVHTFTGGMNLNGGTLALDFANLGTPTDLLNSGNALTLAAGKLTVKGIGTTSQEFSGTTLSAGGGSILVNPNGGTSTTVKLGALTTSTAGGTLLVGKTYGAGTGTAAITTTTDKGATGIYTPRVVFTSNGGGNGGATSYGVVDWATNTGLSGGVYTLSAYSGYATMVVGATSDTRNDRLNLGDVFILTGAHTHNSLKIENTSGSGRIFALGSNLLTLNSGGLLLTGNQYIIVSGTTGATRLTAGSGSDYELIIQNYNVSTTNYVDISAVIGNNGGNTVSVTMSGPGITRLTGANTYTGVTTVNGGLNAGRWDLTGVGNVGQTSSIKVNEGGQLSVGGAFDVSKNIEIAGCGRIDGATSANPVAAGAIRLINNASYSGQISLTGDSRIGSIGAVAVSATVSGKITGNYGIDFLGSGSANNTASVISVSNTANDYAGETSITNVNYSNGGLTGLSTTLKLGAANVLPDGEGKGNLVFNGANADHKTILDLNGNSETVNGLSNAAAAGAQILTSSATVSQTLTVGAGDTTSTFSGLIGGTGTNNNNLGITKTGTGTLTHSGTNTYTGATTVNGGILNITGSTAAGSAVAVGGAGASGTPTLSGSGNVNGAVTLKSAGIGVAGRLNAGDSTSLTKVGTLAMGSTLEFETGSIFEWDINANKDADGAGIDDGTAGTDFDSVSVTGNIDIGSSAIFRVVLGTGVNMANAFWSTPNVTQTWNMATIFGEAFNTGSFSTVQTSTDVSTYGSFSITGGGSTLTWTAVPELSNVLIGGLLGAGLLRRRRRTEKRQKRARRKRREMVSNRSAEREHGPG